MNYLFKWDKDRLLIGLGLLVRPILTRRVLWVIPNEDYPTISMCSWIDGFVRIWKCLQCSTAPARTTPLRVSLHHILLSGTC